MSEAEQPRAEHEDVAEGGREEAVDTLPVPVEEVTAFPVLPDGDGVLERRGGAGMVPAVQAAAAAAGGFVAGAAVVGLVHRRRRRAIAKAGRPGQLKRGRGGRSGTVPGELLQIVGSRSVLLDVHLLGGSGR